jgi:hypothetical protein
MQIYRAIVTASSSTTGSLYVSIPSVLGTSTSIAVSTIGRAAVSGVWTVPDVGDQVLVAVEDDKFSNVFLLYPVEIPIPQTPPQTFTYKVGDTGPGGGIIFFVDRYDEYLDFTYLEVAPFETEVSRAWAQGIYQTSFVPGSRGTAIGTGYSNTLNSLRELKYGNTTNYAFGYCDTLSYGGQTDWFLPSRDELLQIYAARVALSISASKVYWSSTEHSIGNGILVPMDTGAYGQSNKGTELDVRPVRSFTSTTTYAVGDVGPAGGKVFITPSTSGNTTGQYFEAANVDADVIRTWAPDGFLSTTVRGANFLGLGQGTQNTQLIVNQGNSNASLSAAKYCDTLDYGGKTDWYLPSHGELAELFGALRTGLDLNLFPVGVLTSLSSLYWSSSERYETTALASYPPETICSIVTNSTAQLVRAVRKF